MNANQFTNLKTWIVNRERTGLPCFSFQEAADVFPDRPRNALAAALSRFCASGLLQRVHRAFFCVVPPHYALRGRVPPMYYLEALMAHLGKPWYIAALSAAAHWGASHQKVMATQVMTSLPHASTSSRQNPDIAWFYRKCVPDAFLVRETGETGCVRYSNPELTALDLVRLADRSGGMSLVASVLADLKDATDFSGAARGVFLTAAVPDIQRLGYLYDAVLHAPLQAKVIQTELRGLAVPLRSVPLATASNGPVLDTDRRWHIRVNVDIDNGEDA